MKTHRWPPPQGHDRHPAAADLEHDVQRRMYWFGCAFMAAVGPLYLLLALLYVHRPSLWGGLVFIYASLAAVALWAQRGGNYTRALTLLHGTSFIGVMIPALGDVNVGTPSFWWMTVIPFVALLSGLTLLGKARTRCWHWSTTCWTGAGWTPARSNSKPSRCICEAWCSEPANCWRGRPSTRASS